MKITIKSLRLVNGSNAREHHHKRAKHTKAARERARVEVLTVAKLGTCMLEDRAAHLLPAIITVTRIAPNKLDAHDGLPAACKPVIDGIADALIGKYVKVVKHVFGKTWSRGKRVRVKVGTKETLELRSDDSDPRITWRVAQRYGGVRMYGCEVLIEPRADCGFVDADSSARVEMFPHGLISVTSASHDAFAGAHLNAQQLRAFIVQADRALQEMMEEEHER